MQFRVVGGEGAVVGAGGVVCFSVFAEGWLGRCRYGEGKAGRGKGKVHIRSPLYQHKFPNLFQQLRLSIFPHQDFLLQFLVLGFEVIPAFDKAMHCAFNLIVGRIVTKIETGAGSGGLSVFGGLFVGVFGSNTLASRCCFLLGVGRGFWWFGGARSGWSRRVWRDMWSCHDDCVWSLESGLISE